MGRPVPQCPAALHFGIDSEEGKRYSGEVLTLRRSLEKLTYRVGAAHDSANLSICISRLDLPASEITWLHAMRQYCNHVIHGPRVGQVAWDGDGNFEWCRSTCAYVAFLDSDPHLRCKPVASTSAAETIKPNTNDLCPNGAACPHLRDGGRCVRRHPTIDIPCRFGSRCTSVNCRFAHSAVETEQPRPPMKQSIKIVATDSQLVKPEDEPSLVVLPSDKPNNHEVHTPWKLTVAKTRYERKCVYALSVDDWISDPYKEHECFNQLSMFCANMSRPSKPICLNKAFDALVERDAERCELKLEGTGYAEGCFQYGSESVLARISFDSWKSVLTKLGILQQD